MSLFFYSFAFETNLRQRKFVTADVTAVFVNNQHAIQRRGQDFDKKFVFDIQRAGIWPIIYLASRSATGLRPASDLSPTTIA